MSLSFGCTTDDGIVYPVDVAWTSYISSLGADIYNENSAYVETGDYLFLRDCSQGALSHEWFIDDKVSFFTDVEDTTTTIPDKTSTDLDAYILFEKSGWTTITMRNTFAEETVPNTSSSYAASVNNYYDEDEGVWVFEKTWSIEIYGSLKPAFTVQHYALDGTQTEVLNVSGDEETSSDYLTEITISQGDILQFVYDESSDYKSSGQTWTVTGGVYDMNNSTDYVATYSFNTVGTYSGYSLYVWRDVINSGSTDQILASNYTKVVPIKVNVDYANIAISVASIYQQSDGRIVVPLSKEIKTPLDTSLASAFSIKFVGKDGTESSSVAITDVEISPSDNTALLLTMETGDLDNYQFSHGLLSYTPATDAYIYDGSINSISDPIAGVSDASVTLYGVLDSQYFDFNTAYESPSNVGNIINGWWFNYVEASTSDNGSFVDVIADPTDTTGEDKAMRFYLNGEVEADDTHYIALAYYQHSSGEELTAGKYKLYGRLYVNEFVETSTGAGTAYLQAVFNNGGLVLCSIPIHGRTIGEWVEIDEEITISAGTTFTNFRLQSQYTGASSNVSNLTRTDFYIDDLYMTLSEID